MSGAPPIPQLALTIVCLLAVGALIYAEYRGHARLRIGAKLVASLAFVVLGTEAFGLDPRFRDQDAAPMFARWIFVGLVFGALGDAALLGHGKRWFLAGLVAFLIGHIAYVVAVACVEPPAHWLGHAGPLAALPVIVGGTALVLLWPKLGSMTLPVMVYVITIITMVVGAIAIARGDQLDEPHRYLFVAGASLFFVSDLAVARDRFVARTFANKAWGLPAYYGGQLLIAWSLVGLSR
jgi:uncharacterized membrane protein YhhN